MDIILILMMFAIVIVLIFDYTNGFHDAANIVATVIASRTMTPVHAVLIVGLCEFLGQLLGDTAPLPIPSARSSRSMASMQPSS